MNTGITYLAEYRKTQNRKNSVFGHFSRSAYPSITAWSFRTPPLPPPVIMLLCPSNFCCYIRAPNSQHALISLIERWRKSLDNKGYGCGVLMDLSKAFDTLNHDLLIAKLQGYGFDTKTLKLLHSYLRKRWQRTKVYSNFITLSELLQGVPQGSVLGPILFNI